MIDAGTHTTQRSVRAEVCHFMSEFDHSITAASCQPRPSARTHPFVRTDGFGGLPQLARLRASGGRHRRGECRNNRQTLGKMHVENQTFVHRAIGKYLRVAVRGCAQHISRARARSPHQVRRSYYFIRLIPLFD